MRLQTILKLTFGVGLFVSGCASTENGGSSLSARELHDRAIHRRAVEAVIWGMPAVNAELMFQAMKDAKGDFNQVVYWSRPASWKNQTLTPNPDTIYFMPFFNTKETGPMVLEIPPVENESSITGSIDEAWQTALEDVGPAGVDKGKGGKYLILPPDYKDKTPDGYIVLPSGTCAGYALLRSNFKTASDADIAKAVAYGKRAKFYPLSQAANRGGPPETKFVDAYDVLFDATIPYDLRFFQTLDRFMQREPWYERDKVMIDSLKTIGIEKGKPFNPDASTQKILNDAAREAHAWIDMKYEGHFATPYNPGTRWALPADPEVLEGLMTNFAKPDAYPVDGRGVGYSQGYFSAKHLGTGQFYLMTIADNAGKPLDGGSTYRLHIPPDAPVTLYWSATAYDRATHGLIRDAAWSSRGSNTAGLAKNADGSADIYFAPKAPDGKELNWVPTKSGAGFEVLFRLYGPEKPFFDKVWKLPDIEMVRWPLTKEFLMKRLTILIAISFLASSAVAQEAQNIPVTVDNFIRAETDRTFAANVKQGAFGKFEHLRALAAIDDQRVQRQNRDTLYSVGVFDLDAGPVTITMPDSGKRFITMMVIDEDHYVFTVVYEPGTYAVARDKVGTRYALAAIRTLVDPNDPKDLAQVHALQDAVKLSQPGGPGQFQMPDWDQVSRKKVADVLGVLGETLVDWRGAAGRKGEVDPIRHLIVTATGWGLNPDKDAIYLNIKPKQNDGKTIYKVTVKDVPVDGFWSISLYNAQGYFQKNEANAYSLNNITAKKNADGSVTVQFGGDAKSAPNVLPIMSGWNYTVRLYRPRQEIINGTWRFPEAEPQKQ